MMGDFGAVKPASAVLVAVALIASCSSITADAHPHSADCMKNPFASGCRGISAKRSVLAPLVGGWQAMQAAASGGPVPFETSDYYRLISPAERISQASGRPIVASSNQRQLNTAVDLLVEAASRLMAIGPIESLGSQRTRACNLVGLDGVEPMVATEAASSSLSRKQQKLASGEEAN